MKINELSCARRDTVALEALYSNISISPSDGPATELRASPQQGSGVCL